MAFYDVKMKYPKVFHQIEKIEESKCGLNQETTVWISFPIKYFKCTRIIEVGVQKKSLSIIMFTE